MRPLRGPRFRLSLAATLSLLLARAALAGGGPMPDVRTRIAARAHALHAAAALGREAAVSYRRHALRAARAVLRAGSDNPIDVVHTLVALDADEAAGTIDAVITVTVRATENGVASASFYVQRLDELRVEDESGTALEHTYEESWGQGHVTVTLPRLLDQDEEAVLRFFNRGTPSCAPDDYFGMTMCQVSPEIVFFAGADWVPTKVAASYEEMYRSGGIDLDITTPPGYVAATTSDPAGVEDLGDRLVHHFVGHFADLYPGLAYARFGTFSAPNADAKPVTTYIHTGSRDYGQRWAEVCADVVDYYAGIYSPYLYHKHDAIQAVEELGGGVGPQSATFYAASVFGDSPEELYSESLFSHEIAHSWWGNLIRPGDPYSPWLDEGFAEYSSRLYGYRVWPAYYQDYLYEVYFHYFQYAVPPENEVPLSGPAIFTDDSMTYFFITYYKGAHLLRMLQWLLGDEAFFAGMSAYAADHVWEDSHTVVDVPAFEQALEAASGLDLAPFFERWVYTVGYPVYRWAAEFGESAAGYTVRVRAEQVQKDDTGIDTVFEIPLEIAVWVGEEETPRRERLTFSGTVADHTFAYDAVPRGVEVDPSSWIWGDKIDELVGDVDSSNEVDGIDFLYAAWSQGGQVWSEEADSNYYFKADFNRDGQNDEADLELLLANFGKRGTIDE